MANAYNDLVSLVRDWSNRDSQVLPDSIVESSLRYSADEAYRMLKIPPLEFTTYFVLNETGVTEAFHHNGTNVTVDNVAFGKVNERNTNRVATGTLPVPGDAITFMHLRILGTVIKDDLGRIQVSQETNGTYTIDTETSNRFDSVVFNEKTDTRTFHDIYADKTSYNYWSREGSDLLIAGDIQEGLVIALHYYRRLDALNAREEITEDTPADQQEAITLAEWEELTVLEQDTYTYNEAEDLYERSTVLVDNWLRDENERVLLYGALKECFFYLQEPEQSNVYSQRYMQAIEELNQEEKKRLGSGGNVQINYNGFGQI